MAMGSMFSISGSKSSTFLYSSAPFLHCHSPLCSAPGGGWWMATSKLNQPINPLIHRGNWVWGWSHGFICFCPMEQLLSSRIVILLLLVLLLGLSAESVVVPNQFYQVQSTFSFIFNSVPTFTPLALIFCCIYFVVFCWQKLDYGPKQCSFYLLVCFFTYYCQDVSVAMH